MTHVLNQPIDKRVTRGPEHVSETKLREGKPVLFFVRADS